MSTKERLKFGKWPTTSLLSTVIAAGLSGDTGIHPPVPDCPVRMPSSPDFVYQKEGDLYLGDERLRLPGFNIFYFGLSPLDGVRLATEQEVYDALHEAKIMGAQHIRLHAISVGHSRSVEPELGVFQPEALAALDYAIYVARQLDLKFTLVLTDNWSWYHGGRHTFTHWRGVPSDEFFDNPQIISDV